MTYNLRLALALTLSLACVPAALMAQHAAMPPGMTHAEHMEQMKKEAAMKEHGKHAMGFDQETTTHHFTLEADGGSIAVDVKAASDAAGLAQIRAHLREIAGSFKQGDFTAPFVTHSEQPPGVATLQRLKAELTYSYADTALGGIVRISTSNSEALDAVHTFLKYQITEHKTGDSLTPRKRDRE